MADMFYFRSPAQDNVLVVKYLASSTSSSSKRRKRLVKRDPRQMARMERACMARFAEPVFGSNALVSLLPGSQALTLCEDLSLEDDAARSKPDEGMLDDEELFVSSSTNADVTLLPAQDGAQSWCEASRGIADETARPHEPLELDRAMMSRDSISRSEKHDGVQHENRNHGRLAPDLKSSNDHLPLESRRNLLPRSRIVSHQPSCDSLRNSNSLTADALQSQLLITASQSNLDLQQQDSLLEELRLQYSHADQYTVLTDMAETAWSVDDPRHSADFIDDMTTWPKLTAALVQRACADESKLPAFNRQEAIASSVDMQGLDWHNCRMSRQQALFHRTTIHEPPPAARFIPEETYSSFMNNIISQRERHYRFHYFNGLRRPQFTHHQLRHCLASSGRDVFFADSSKVMRSTLACPSVNDTVLDLTKSTRTLTPIRITCLAATDSMIIAGGFNGEYALGCLDHPSQHSEGYVNDHRDGVVTHIHTFSHRRSGLPQAAFCANDQRIRLLDIGTQTFTNTLAYHHPLNAAATASDGRLRTLVGDCPDALITDAESGETLVTLRSHTDHIFACAWSPDDRLLATAAQDGKIALWDSRNWSQPLAEPPNVMSCSRSLHFTADSSLLVSAENQDVVSVLDTRDLVHGRQDICFFGTIAGVALVDGGDEVVVANGDRSVGGLMSFRRTNFNGWFQDRGGSLDPVKRRRRRAARRMGARRVEAEDDGFLWC